jgi:hypothetical protein
MTGGRFRTTTEQSMDRNQSNSPTRTLSWVVIVAGAIAVVLSSPQATADKFETPPTLSASELFGHLPLKGDRYEVVDEVQTDGFLTRTTIESEFGDFTAVGPGMLAVRLNEVSALKKLEDLENDEEFQKGVKDAAGEKWDALKQIAENPRETAEGLSEGVGRFFKRAYRSAKTGAQTVGDVMQERSPGSGETDGPGAALPGKATGQQAVPDRESKYVTAAKASGNVAVNILGFDDARRGLAKRLVVDPYTTNHTLDARLDEVTWSIFAGNLGVDIATAMIPGGAIVSASTMVNDWVWDTPPGDLRVKIDETLQGVGVEQELIDRLLRHRFYTLSMQAALTAALESLDGVSNRVEVMPLALSVTTVDQARFVVGTLRMLAQYHKEVGALDRLTVSGTVTARRDDGLIVAAPVDYLSWNEDADRFSSRDDLGDGPRSLFLAGRASEKARAMLKDRGWTVEENSALYVQVTGKKN